MSTENTIIAVVFLLLYLAFLFWYGGQGKPLSQVEVDALLAEMKRRAGKQAQEEETPILHEFRELPQNDDGREYYMVNLLGIVESVQARSCTITHRPGAVPR